MSGPEPLARLQLEALRASLEDAERMLRMAFEAPSPEKLVRMRAELLAAEARRLAAFARRNAALAGADRRGREAARVVEASMAALGRQSTGMWEVHLRACRHAIEQALAAQTDT